MNLKAAIIIFSVLFVCETLGALALPTSCDPDGIIGLFCIMQNNTTDDTANSLVQSPEKILCKVTSYEELCTIRDKAREILAADGKTTATPEEVAAALKEAGWNEEIKIATIPPQIITSKISGKITATPINAEFRTLLTVAEETHYGVTAIDVINVDFLDGYLILETNGWSPSDGNETGAMINPFKVSALLTIA